MSREKMCRHCASKPANKARGLCHRCYFAPGVRDLYPTSPTRGRSRGLHADKGPVCWGCGRPDPDHDWMIRKVKLVTGWVTEMQCPGCFAVAGWIPERPFVLADDVA